MPSESAGSPARTVSITVYGLNYLARLMILGSARSRTIKTYTLVSGAAG